MADGLALGFDTSAAHCAAALVSGTRILAARHEDMAKGQAERLFPLLAELLAERSGNELLAIIAASATPLRLRELRARACNADDHRIAELLP